MTLTHQHITHEGYDEPSAIPDRCPRCGRTLHTLTQRTVILRDALSPPIFVHEDCSYDMEWANGAASYYQETDQ